LSRIDFTGLRDVIVAIWTSRLLQGSVGHVYVGEMNGSTILSQFPTPHAIEGRAVQCYENSNKALYAFQGRELFSCYKQLNKRRQQRFSALSNIMHKLEKTQI
jgi:hypothetical protein